MDDTGLRPPPACHRLEPQTAIVVGPNRSTSASGADESHTDRLGRVRGNSTGKRPLCPQRASGDHGLLDAGHASAQPVPWANSSFPALGKVLVGFINNDMDQPTSSRPAHNGQGEGGTPPRRRAKPSR